MIRKCSKCDSPIVYSYNVEYNSYYLRCKRDYECWHKGCDKDTALKYPRLKTKSENLLENIKESIDNGDDYYHGYDF